MNSERWEKRAKEKFGELKGKVEELETAVEQTPPAHARNGHS